MHFGNTAENEKRDAADGHTETLSYRRMGHFMENDREEQADGRKIAIDQ